MEPDRLADLIRRAQQRDASALDALVELFAGRVFGLAFRLTASRHDAEDLTQEVFLRVVRMIGHYRHEDRFEPWLFRIAANLIRDRARRRQRSPVRFDRADEDGSPPTTGIEAEPGRSIETGEELDRMNAALGRLPESEREVIMLRHFSDMSFKEIADAMGTPLGTALARAHRGLARLRELMAPAAVSDEADR